MIKDIIQIGDERLLSRSSEIPEADILSDGIKVLAQDLIDTCKFHVEEAAGLSAVQIGVLKRIYVVRRVDFDEDFDETAKWEVMINPEITILDRALNTEWEGCMSISSNKQRLFGPVSRPRSIRVEYTNLNGQRKTLHAKDFFASLIQHEQDHLDGKLFLSYISNPKNIWREEDLNKYIKLNRRMPNIF